MAISKIKPRHASEGRSIAAILKDRIDYDKNPEKTKGGLLVSSYQCGADTAWREFTVSKQIYEAETGRGRAPKDDVISYLIIQSFKPGEITPEEANELGYQLALEFTGGQHQFIVATHTDRHHIHCHIEFNSTTLDCTHKFNNYWNTYKTIRAINDRLSREHGLSVIEKPKEKGKHYAEWASGRRGASWKDRLRRTIDRVLPTVSSYEEFLAAMRQEGYEIQTTRKVLSFRLAGEGQERFTRAKTLGADYTEEALKERIGRPMKRPRRRSAQLQKNGRVNLLLDIQSRLQGRGPGYERWLKIHNLKEAAKTLNFLTEHGITEYDLLAARASSAAAEFEQVSSAIKQYEKRMEQVAALKTHIINYAKTRDVFAAYRKARPKDRAAFRTAHEAELLLHEAAKRAFDDLGSKKLPTVKVLQEEYADLLAKKKAAYEDYKRLRKESQELQTVKANVDALLKIEQVQEYQCEKENNQEQGR